MKTIREFMDEAIAKGYVRNDAEIATKVGVAQATVSRWRDGSRVPEDDEAFYLAEALMADTDELMPTCRALKTKSPFARAVWERLATRSHMIAACSAMLVANLLFASPTAEAAPPLALAPLAIGIMLSLAFLAGRRRSDAHACARHEFQRPEALVPA